jgi:co-chaperonin GroES (HSP10)
VRPRSDRVVVEREPNERVLPWGFIVPGQDLGLAFVGRITHVGPGRSVRGRNLQLDVAVGGRIVYSTRIDSYGLDDGSCIDVVEEDSIIGKLE